MEKFLLSNFFRGWLVGNFEPTLLKTKEIEVALQKYHAGEEEPQHHHKVATEISLLVSGSATFNSVLVKEGEGVLIQPKEANIFRAVTDCKVLVIKYPSDSEDKYLGEHYD